MVDNEPIIEAAKVRLFECPEEENSAEDNESTNSDQTTTPHFGSPNGSQDLRRAAPVVTLRKKGPLVIPEND